MHHSYLDKYARQDSLLHRLDARPKLLIILALVVTVAATQRPGLLFILSMIFLIVALCLISRIPLDYLLLRSAVVLPFTGFIALSLLLTTAGPREFWQWGPFTLSEYSLHLASALLLRSWIAVSLVILLVNLCSFDRILSALRSFKVPAIFVLLLSFLYRYLYLLWDERERLQRARDLRYFGGRWQERTRLLGYLAAALFVRSYERAERVQKAMAARGWNGEVKFVLPAWPNENTLVLAVGALVISLLWLIRHQ